MGDRIGSARTNDRSLMLGGKKGRGPVLRAVRGKATVIRENDEGRQFIAQVSQTITDPATHAWKTGTVESGRLQIGGLAVDTAFSGDVVHE